jgi:outer membrane protein, multidrug efflux system
MGISQRLRGCLVSAVVALGICGCTVGPDYRRPEAPIPDDWVGTGDPQGVPATQASAARQTAADLARWWSGLDDSELDSLIERAAESNLDLRQAEARIRQARAARGISSSSLFPRLDTSARYSNSGSGPGEENDESVIVTLPDGSTVTRSVGGGESTSRNLFRAGIDAAWEIDVFGGIRRDVEAADADVRFAIEDRRDVLITLISEVALNYIDLRQFQRQIDIAQRNLEAQERTAAVTRRRQAGGEASGLDVANAEAQVASTRSQIPSLRTLERQAIHSLSVLLGLPPGALLQELSQMTAIPTVPPEIPIGLPSELLLRRPDVRRAEAQAHAATARIGVAIADLFPRFSLTGALGVQGERAGSLTRSGDNYFWSFGPSITWPLFDAGRIRSNIALQEASQQQALLVYRATILTALQEVENALVAYASEQERRQSLIRAVQQSRRSVELSIELYTQGQIEFLNVLTAQRALFSSEDALVQSDRTVVTNLIAIYKALGGGWEPPAEPSISENEK